MNKFHSICGNNRPVATTVLRQQPSCGFERAKTLVAQMTATLVLFLALVCSITPVKAGYYTVSYSGGSATSITDSNGTVTHPYGLGNDSYYGGGEPFSWGAKMLPDGTFVPTSGSLHCNGAITATFTWQPSTADDTSPKSVVIAEASTASSSGSAMTIVAPTVFNNDNGLGFPAVAGPPPPPQIPITTLVKDSQGTRYQIKSQPGNSFSITCSPSVDIEGKGSVDPNGSGGGGGGVSYKATASPLELVLSGGIGSGDNKQFLVGQRVTGDLSTGGLQATSFDWSVNGGEPFKNWTADQTHTTFAALGAENGGQLSFYFRKALFKGVKANVSCDFHLNVPTGAQPAGGFDLTLYRDCVVDKPSNSLQVLIGATKANPNAANPTGMKFAGAVYTSNYMDYTAGILWLGQVTTPVEYGGGGGWNYTQLILQHRVRTNMGVRQHLSSNGTQMLDDTFGYQPIAPDVYPADGNEQVQGDSPAEPFASSLSYVEILDSFVTYTLYRPPGAASCFVPLKNLNWYWEGEAQPNASGTWQVFNTNGDWSFMDDFPTHPMWQSNAINREWLPVFLN